MLKKAKSVTKNVARTGIQMLCTLGPSSLNKQVIERLTDRGVDFFRINMSHTSLESLEEVIRTIRQYSPTPICIDSEGAQVRTGELDEVLELKDRQWVTLCPGRKPLGDGFLPLWPACIFEQLRPGHLVAVDFDSALLMVRGIREDGFFDAVVINGGVVGKNKACTLNPAPVLPPLSEKDIACVEIALRHRIENFALSFANSAQDVQQLRELVGAESNIISKVESVAAVKNLDGILDASDAILIDRGDLSREVPFENIPLIQKAIIGKANAAHRPVYVATNLLESMMTNRKPTRAELNDVMNTLIDGANGLVLAAETAVGNHPVVAVDMLATLVECFEKSLDGYRIGDLLEITSPLLPKPHGVQNATSTSQASPVVTKNVDALPSLDISEEDALDIAQLANGAFSPMDGFMDKSTLESVLNDNRLPSGEVWTMPIILQFHEEQLRGIEPGMSVRLSVGGAVSASGVLHITDKYQVDLKSVAVRWFGTDDTSHPGVDRLVRRGCWILAGSVENIDSAGSEWSHYNLSPSKTRMIFGMKGWSKIVAFHTRNVPHRGHEYVVRKALERTNADGLFIHPLVGPKKSGDFVPEAILGVYDRLIEDALPGALLGAFMTYPRYCGPREAVFTALCRKNFGCTHFIVGRDHAGVGDFYKGIDVKRFVEGLGELGIQMVFFDKVSYCTLTNSYVEDPETQSHYESISGTRVRDLIKSGEDVPDWCIRPTVLDWLRAQHADGKSLFVS